MSTFSDDIVNVSWIPHKYIKLKIEMRWSWSVFYVNEKLIATMAT